MIAMTLAMVIAVSSDTLITRYYRDAQSSFYAADSGLNVARQYMLSQIVAAVPTTFSSTSQPIPAGTETTVATAVSTQYGSATSMNAGQAAASWPSKFNVVGTPTLVLSNCQVVYSGTATNTGPYTCTNVPTCTGACTGFGITDYQYTYNYTLAALGQGTANEQQNMQDAGNLLVNVHVGPAAGTVTSFAAWGMFIDQYPQCSADLVPGTVTGPVFTNGAWTFGTSGSYTYTDKVGSVSPTFGFDSGGCYGASTVPQPGFAVNFQSGSQLGAHAIPLPGNSFNQKEAVVDGLGNSGGVTNGQMNAALKTYSGAAYPSAGTTNPGVYLGYSQTTSGGTTTNTMTGGGIYVEGNADSVVLTASNPSSGAQSGHALQIFTIKQGTTTTTVTVDQTSNMTTVASKTGSGSTTTTTINGVPENFSSGSASPATMFYVDGTISSLSGPAQGVPAIQNGAAVTVTAANDMTVTGDIIYKAEPVTFTPADTVISANNYGQVLGLFTAGGNVNLANSQSNGMLEIDASIATIQSGGSGGIANTGSAINTLTIVGGRIQNTIQNINATTRNVWFDRRFLQGGFAPPWFPSTTVTPSATDAVTSIVTSVQRTQWLDLY
jgi:Tfp pilus assembly protein PilX